MLFLLLFAPGGSYACSCIDLPSFEENIANYDRILLVELKKYRTLFLKRKCKLNIKEVFKGEAKPALQSLVSGDTSCDPQLVDKQEWVVFLKEDSKNLQLGWCGPHQRLDNLKIGTPHWRELIKTSN